MDPKSGEQLLEDQVSETVYALYIRGQIDVSL